MRKQRENISLGFSIPKKEGELVEEKTGHELINVTRALLTELVLDPELQERVKERLHRFQVAPIPENVPEVFFG